MPRPLGREVIELCFDVLRESADVAPAEVLRVLVLDGFPHEHAMAAAEVLHGTEATSAWRSAVPHDAARLWTYRGDLRPYGGKMIEATAPAPSEKRGSQTGFDFG